MQTKENEMTDFWTCWDGLENEWVYVESGPNYGEAGLLKEVHIDGLGVAWGILDHCRRKDDESDGSEPTWLLNTGDGIRVPSTSVTLIQKASDRWPAWKAPQ
jgi:hypothetical protein